ncbi:MAG: hypothetical protein ABDH63_02620 [Candidatus Caldarchaeales archaeon]
MSRPVRVKVTATFGDDSLPELDEEDLRRLGLVEAVRTAVERFGTRRSLVERFGDEVPSVLPDPVVREVDLNEFSSALAEVGLGGGLPVRFSYRGYAILLSVEAGCG